MMGWTHVRAVSGEYDAAYRPHPWTGPGSAVALIVVSACAVAFATDPDGAGGYAFVASAGVSILGMIVGPLALGARPVRLWAAGSLGGLFFLISLVLRLSPDQQMLGPLAMTDLVCFGGYVFLAAWLVQLLRLTAVAGEPRLWLDSALVAAGAGLALWAITISPHLTNVESLVDAMVAASYPVFDLMLLTLTVQLLFRAAARVAATWFFLGGLAIMLALDTAYTFIWAVHPGLNIPALNAVFLYAYALFALGGCHPSVRGLAQRIVPDARRVGNRHSILLVSMLVPAVVSTVVPLEGTTDMAVRIALFCVLFSLIYTRLVTTLTALSAAEAESRHSANCDALTGLPNRFAVTADLEDTLAAAPPAWAPWVVVLVVDLDDFKRVNDTWGHSVGDVVISEVARRLRAVVPSDIQMLARVGGDEFLIVTRAADSTIAVVLAERILNAVREPMEVVAGHTMRLTASIGIAQARARLGSRAEELLRDADIALYDAKGRGRARWARFDTSLRTEVRQRVLLAEALRSALPNGEISVHFQPIVGGTGFTELVGWEALARWQHPVKGWISPEVFVPIAENTGLILEIGAFILGRSCEELVRLRAESGRDDLHVSVNVSPIQMIRGDLVGDVEAVLARTGLPPHTLWLEITESVIVERGHDIALMLTRLKELGVVLCMDDFGMGYSSLGTLHEFPLDIVKADRAFIQDLHTSASSVAVMRAIVELASALGVTGVVAEGVELPEQAAALEALGCDMVQGWLYGRPSPAHEIRMTDVADVTDVPVEADIAVEADVIALPC